MFHKKCSSETAKRQRSENLFFSATYLRIGQKFSKGVFGFFSDPIKIENVSRKLTYRDCVKLLLQRLMLPKFAIDRQLFGSGQLNRIAHAYTVEAAYSILHSYLYLFFVYLKCSNERETKRRKYTASTVIAYLVRCVKQMPINNKYSIHRPL